MLVLDDATAARLAVLRRKLDELRARDVAMQEFGADAHRYAELPPLDEAQLTAHEQAWGVRLPDEVRAFALTMHAGGPGPAYGMLPIVGPAPRIAEPFRYGDADVAELFARRATDRRATLPLVEEGDDWPPGGGFLPLAHLGCGVYDVIVTTGEQRATIWRCDMAWLPMHRIDRDPPAQLGFFDWYEDWLDRART